MKIQLIRARSECCLTGCQYNRFRGSINMKICPNCGKENRNDAKFCSNCGYDFTKGDRSTNANDKDQPFTRNSARKRAKSTKARWIIGVVILLCVLGGGWFFFHNEYQAAPRSNQTATQSANTNAQSNNATSTQNSSSVNSTADNSAKLSTDIGPKETAAAIAYYAKESGLEGWKEYFNEDDDLTIILDSNYASELSAPGQGMVYGVLNSQINANGITRKVYTIDKDNTVNIYNLSVNPDTPLKSVSKDEIIQYINDHGDTAAVKKLGSNITLDQESN